MKKPKTITHRSMNYIAKLCALADASNPFAYARKLNEFRRDLDDPAEACEEAMRMLAVRGVSAQQIAEYVG